MKKIKAIAWAAALCALSVLLSSCNMTAFFGKIGVTTPPTLPEQTSAVPEEGTKTPTAEIPSLEGLDLTKYMSLEYKGLILEVDEIPGETTDAELEEELRGIMLEYEKYTLITDRKTAAGDYIEMSYSGTVDGEPLAGGQSEKALILLDDENSGYIPGFAAGLIGATPGETVTLHLTFPENYYAEIAGKPVDFDVTIKGICLFEFTDAIASELSSGNYPTAAAYREHLREYIKTVKDYSNFSACYNTLWQMLFARMKITIYPADLVEYYYQSTVSFILDEAAYYNITYDEYMKAFEYTDETLREKARESAAKDMMVQYIANAEQIRLSDEEYEEYLDNMVNSYLNQGYAISKQEIIDYYAESYGPDFLKKQALQEKAGLRVFELAELVEKTAPADTDPAQTDAVPAA